MKKLAFLVLVFALLVSCKKEEPDQPKSQILFSSVSIDALNRAGFDNTITTDNLADFDVWGHNGAGVVFDGTKVEKQGDLWVCAEEKMWEPYQTYHFHAFAPSGAVENIGEYPNSERAKGLSNFAYTNDGSKDLIYAYATRTQGSPRRINDDPVQLEFEHLLSRVQFTFKNNLSEGNITISNVQITDAVKSAELNCADASIANWTWNATSTGAYNFGATSTIAKGASGTTENVQFLFPAATQNYNISFNFTYESDAAEERTATISDVNLVMGKSYNINLVVNDKDVVTEEYKIEFFVTEVKDWGENIELDATINEPGHGFENGYEWVDLGLPSDLKWATCNVGANAPEEYGDYFAWGEVEPKEYYDWSTYKYCDGVQLTYTKYCNKSSYGNNGFTDDKTVLDPEDDAAIANWGGTWRMPTYDEYTELRDNCTWILTIQNGVNGYKVIGSNSNSIFLPLAGAINRDELSFISSDGFYWSSSLCLIEANAAEGLFLSLDYLEVDGIGGRSSGVSVRAVCP